MNQYFWYQACYSDARGVCHAKEGDIAANNLLHAANRVEKWNKENWKGTMVYLRLYQMDFDTGYIREDPVLNWTRHGMHGNAVRHMDVEHGSDDDERFIGRQVDWDADAWEKGRAVQTSQSVTIEPSFDPALLGDRWYKTHRTFTTATLKEK